MGGKDSNYQVVYRGEVLKIFREGEWVFFQRSKEYGGGYWFGRTYPDCFWLEFDAPISLRQGMDYLMALNSIRHRMAEFDDDQFGLPF